MPFESINNRQSLVGWLTGIVAPMVSIVVLSLLWFDGMTVSGIFRMYLQMHLLGHVLSLGAVTNLLFFFLFLKTDKDRAARGVLGATFLYVFVVIWLKYF